MIRPPRHHSLALAAAAIALTGCSAGQAQDYFVDFAAGSDNASGTAGGTPWRHAPGDALATGRAAATRLGPGDTVHFKGGTAYRGAVVVNGDGTAVRPITFTGSGYGAGPAVIDGSDPVTAAVPCPSAAACGGAAGWADLKLVSFNPPATAFIKFYDAIGPLVEAQVPAPKDPFYADEIQFYAVSPLADREMIESGRLRAPELAARLAGAPGGVLSIWVSGNQVVRRAVTGIDGDTLLFAPGGIRLYADRPGRYALTGIAAAISAPGQYAVIAPGEAVVRTRPGGGALSIGNGRGGFNLGGHSGIGITGFVFTHQTAAPEAQREGLPVDHGGGASTGITITGNRFENSALWNGQGVITLRNVDGATVKDNIIDTIERGSGLRAGANVQHLAVSGNTINRVGRTGIAFLGVSDSSIAGNVIDGLRGIHGNGISLYLTNRRIAVTDNRVTGTSRPMTFHGDKNLTAPGDHDFTIERNVFIATSDAQAALTSWGGATRNVTIRNNVLVAPKGGMLLNGSDTGLIVEDNDTSGIIYNHGQGADWKIGANRDAARSLRAGGEAGVARLCKAAGLAKGATLGGVPC